MHKTNCINITNKLYGKDIFVKLYNKTLLQRFTVKVWRNGLVYIILRAGRVITDCVKVGRSPCPNAFKGGPCVNIDFLVNSREYWPLIGQSGFKSSCSDG